MPPFIIDVSAAQPPGSIDIASARAAGMIGAIVRAEYGTRIDAAFHAWMDLFIAAGVAVGVYAFQLTDHDPLDEVDVLMRELDAYALDYGVALDIETRNNASPGNVTTWARSFIEEVEQRSGDPFGAVYTAAGFWSSLGDVGLDAYWATRKLWVANYGVPWPHVPHPWGGWKLAGGPVLWQAYGNTIWKDRATGQQKWGKVQPGPSWIKIASAYPTPWSRAEVDVSLLPGDDDAPLRVAI